jgi:DNA-binding GntR family transcriptional regulator
MKKETKVDQVYSYLYKAIMNQELGMGTPISELAVSKQLNISRTPIRDAIQRLKAEQILESIPGKGVFVKIQTRELIKENYEMMEALEGMCVYLIAETVEEEKIRSIEPYLVEMESIIQSENRQISRWLQNDEMFHSACYAMCPNNSISKQLNTVNDLLVNMNILSSGIISDFQRSTNEHRVLYDALINKDSESARIAAQKHWKRIRSELLDYFEYLSGIAK